MRVEQINSVEVYRVKQPGSVSAAIASAKKAYRDKHDVPYQDIEVVKFRNVNIDAIRHIEVVVSEQHNIR